MEDMNCQFFRANQDILKEKVSLQIDIYLESLRHHEGDNPYQDSDSFSTVDLEMFALIILDLLMNLRLLSLV